MNISIRGIDPSAPLGLRAGDGEVVFRWLGQAGFVFQYGRTLLMVDPYLSDHLAEKYRGTEFPHVRMMDSPVVASEVRGLDYVFCTHAHSDHVDPVGLPELLGANPGCMVAAPAAEKEHVIGLGIEPGRLRPMNDGDCLDIAPGVRVRAIPSAHEELKVNERGEHHFLGFIFELGGIKIYHSGDCTPYDGLVDRLRGENIDVAMLPVNGRDEFRTSRGIIGNFNFDEAVELCRSVGIPVMIPHHFGMFDFNTVDVDELRAQASACGERPRCLVPEADHVVVLAKLA